MATPIRGRDIILTDEAWKAIRFASPADVRPADTRLYVDELVSLCSAFNLRVTVLLSQAWHETGAFGPSGRWRELNPAGLGITNSSDATPYHILDGAEAAALHVWSMLIALRDWNSAGRIILPPAANGWKQRWTAKYLDPACPIVANVEDLNRIYSGNRATWATDPAYAAIVLAVMERLFPQVREKSENPAMSITFGRVPHPAYHDRQIWKTNGTGMDLLGRRTVKGVVYHRILGGLVSTDEYFRNPSVRALTDYGVGVAAQDGKALAGVIYRWNDPLGLQSGWASGSYSGAAYGDGLAFFKKYGLNAINRDQASIEIAGFQNTPLDEASRHAIAALTAYWADQYGIPWDVFPIAPQDGFSFVRWHEEFGPDNGTKKCPFDVVKGETADLIERARAIMKQYQTEAVVQPQTPDGSIYASPLTYPWLVRDVADEGVDRKIKKTTVYYFPQVYTAIEETPRNQDAGESAAPIGPPIEPGTKFRADYVFRSRGVSYVLTPYGTRVRAAALLPKIQITSRGTISVRHEKGGLPEVARKAS